MPFKPGQSGNPGGRAANKEHEAIKVLARTYCPKVLASLHYWSGQRKHPATAVAACTALLDRGYGKAAQAVEVSGQLETFIINVVQKSG